MTDGSLHPVFRSAEKSDIPRLKRLWLDCFDDSPDAVDLFFERNIFGDSYSSGCRAYVAVLGDEAVAAVYLIVCSLNGERGHYMCGVATDERFRSRGIMRGLIGFALDRARHLGERFSLLFPSGDSLYDYYARLGYREGCTARCVIVEREGSFEKPPCATADPSGLQSACPVKNILIWKNDFIRFAADYYACYGAKTLSSPYAFAVLEADGEEANVIFALYRGIDSLKSLIFGSGDIKRFRLTGSSLDPLFKGAESFRYGMVKPLLQAMPSDNIYIGITLA